MVIAEESATRRARRIFASTAAVLFVAAALLLYIGYGRQESGDSQHTYTIKQSITSEVRYFDTSFFGNDHAVVPGRAYIADLINTITPRFRYTYESETDAAIAYTYSIIATLRGSATVRDESNSVEVWAEQFVLQEPVSRTESSVRGVAIDEQVQLSFSDYTNLVSQFKNDIAVPIDAQLDVVLTVVLRGDVDGVSFAEDHTATFTVPMDQQVFKTIAKLDEPSTESIYIDGESVLSPWQQPLRIAGYSALLVAIGLTVLVAFVGSERRVFKTPYQRKLARIYRYYDSSIVKASQPVDTAGKQVVRLSSFNDMLDIEEELKTPIIASEIGDEATRFTIIHEDIAYTYTLGVVHQEYRPPATKDQPVRSKT